MVEDSAQLVRVAAKATRLHHLFEMEARRRLEPLAMETHNADTHIRGAAPIEGARIVSDKGMASQTRTN